MHDSRGRRKGGDQAAATSGQAIRPLSQNATLTSPIITGTSISGPMTAANASPELRPNTATATAIASSKLLLAAVNDSEALFASLQFHLIRFRYDHIHLTIS